MNKLFMLVNCLAISIGFIMAGDANAKSLDLISMEINMEILQAIKGDSYKKLAIDDVKENRDKIKAIVINNLRANGISVETITEDDANKLNYLICAVSCIHMFLDAETGAKYVSAQMHGEAMSVIASQIWVRKNGPRQQALAYEYFVSLIQKILNDYFK